MKVSLEVLSGPLDGQIFQFNRSADIGRDTTCPISIPTDKFISRRHARILVVEPDLFIEDNDSTNGTFIDDERLRGRIQLRNGQVFKVGKTWVQVAW